MVFLLAQTGWRLRHLSDQEPETQELGMGRPRLSAKRDRQFGVRMTTAEASAIESAARSRGLPPVAFVRSAALEAAGASNPGDSAAAAEAADQRAELRRIGSNLNQVVRHLHQGRNDREDLAALQSLVEEVRDQVTLEVAR